MSGEPWAQTADVLVCAPQDDPGAAHRVAAETLRRYPGALLVAVGLTGIGCVVLDRRGQRLTVCWTDRHRDDLVQASAMRAYLMLVSGQGWASGDHWTVLETWHR
ncbi:hypothetical protein D5S17_23105 [Pseudonocardiaceae bacterium YIM PH 21723]|nr:hypothetical protein D5S17_23105 [Pseudonocardiaceae bacterium YIM PH 21723]